MDHNPVGWFEIPVEDMKRAMKFYETVFAIKLQHMVFGPLEMARFPALDNAIGSAGALVCNKEYYKPSSNGVLIYFTAFSGDVGIELARVEAAGGKVLQQKKKVSDEYGYMGLFLDSEGNRIAIHSRKG